MDVPDIDATALVESVTAALMAVPGALCTPGLGDARLADEVASPGGG